MVTVSDLLGQATHSPSWAVPARVRTCLSAPFSYLRHLRVAVDPHNGPGPEAQIAGGQTDPGL
jgi:hypothetical protein